MRYDRLAADLPHYEGLLAGHHRKEPGDAMQRPKGTDDWLLVATLSGQGRFDTPSGELLAQPKSLVLLAPGTPHSYGTLEPEKIWEILWVHFHPPRTWLELLRWPSAAPGIFMLETSQSTVDDFHNLVQTSVQPHRRRLQRSLNTLEKLLLDCDEINPNVSPTLDDRISGAIAFIHAKLGAELSVEAMSAHVQLSPSRFAHLFRAETGLAPLQYVHVQRMSRAALLLSRTTLRIGEIAVEIGMEPFYLSARFKEYAGLSPRQYRAEHRDKEL